MRSKEVFVGHFQLTEPSEIRLDERWMNEQLNAEELAALLNKKTPPGVLASVPDEWRTGLYHAYAARPGDSTRLYIRICDCACAGVRVSDAR